MTVKPKPQPTLILLVAIAAAGLIAQLIAAQHAFDLLGRGLIYSASAAILIEAATVGEAIVALRYGDRLAAVLLLITLVVSGIYNYAQAHSAAPDLDGLVKAALAVGPLLALLSVGLLLGAELREYEQRLATWQETRETQQIEQDAADRRRQAEEAQFQRDLERRRFDHQLKEQALATRRAEKHARRTLTGHPDSDRTPGRTAAGQPGQWPDKAAFLSDPDRPTDLSSPELAGLAGISDRTARRWLADARTRGNGHK
jgi:hypothetical protein